MIVLKQSFLNRKERKAISQRTQRFFAKDAKMTENELSNIVIGCAIKVHSALGPGLLESAYQECLFYELRKAGLQVEKQKALPLVYEDVKLECGYRVDLLVEGKLIIEIKAAEGITDIHLAQVLTYLKLSGCKLGLLINFNVVQLKQGIKRVVNNL
jgi:GxxExxY protein